MAEWKNVTTGVMIIVLCLNASFILLDATGITGVLGVSIGLDQTPFSVFTANAQSITTTPNNLGFAEVASIRLAQILAGFWNLGFALPKVLISIGIPGVIVTFLTAPLYACFVLSVIFYITGRAS